MSLPPARSSTASGFYEWLVQRVSALYLAGFALYLAYLWWARPPADFAAWRAGFAAGPVRLAWALFFLSLLVHAWTGMRSVFLDYIHPFWLRLAASIATAFGLIALGAWGAHILVGMTP